MDKRQFLEEKAKEIRKLTINSIATLGVGHVGGSLSIVDILTVLYYDQMHIDPKNPKMPNRDRFVLSKGHGGPAVYATLASKGYFPIELLDTLNQPNTDLPSHTDKNKTIGVDMTTGSLGQGFSAAVGMATAAQLDKAPYKVYAIIGDGESQEGQIWEASMFAGNRKLDHLIAFTDYNKMQIDGDVNQINEVSPLDKKWEAFNWHVQVIDGHDVIAIIDAIQKAKETKGKPSMIICNTIKGKGADFCEGTVGSHNLPVTKEMAEKAIERLGK
ncbi:MAG: transketolase [Acholeplasmataceae bacterium]|jgi:transketolase|nr:transketolase [Acholeplasmataceae bacterium]